jgi:hypothetical protein
MEPSVHLAHSGYLCCHLYSRTLRVPPNTWNAKGCDGCQVSPEFAATHASACGLSCGNSCCVSGSCTGLSGWHLKCTCCGHGSTVGSGRWSSLADGKLLLVLGLLSSHLLLLHGHLLLLEPEALLLSCNLSAVVRRSSTTTAHESVLVLLLKINGP